MCGVAGCVGTSGGSAAVRTMLGTIAHRGPDNHAVWEEGEVALGHARLAIVDLSESGNQPFFSESRDLVLAANGEIYNAAELRRELQAEGHAFSSRSDNEVLLHLCERGEREGDADWPTRLNGMFAFALWDRHRQRLTLGRDRLGIKPLYYREVGGGLVFASEIKAILSHPGLEAAIDPIGLRQYLGFENVFGARSLFRGVRMVRPGELVTFQAGWTKTRSYWEISFDDQEGMDFEEACQAYQDTARESVDRHLMSDVELASYLSGGFDSTTVATLAAERLPGRLRTFTGRFDRSGWYDESKGAEAVASGIGSEHMSTGMGAADFAGVFDELIHHLDEPRMGFGSFSQYMVARQAASRVKVILTGHGGDEFFAGYPVFKIARLLGALGSSPAEVLRLACSTRPAEVPHLAYFLGRAAISRRPWNFLPTIHSSSALEKRLRPDAARSLLSIDPAEGLEELLQGEREPYRRLTRTYMRAYLPGLFVVEDKISMAHSLESRTPLCDNAMVDLALRMPFGVKLHQSELKAVPKAAMRERLPGILYRLPKRGFPTPLNHWLRGDLRQWTEERLTASDSPLRGLFTDAGLAGAWRSFRDGWHRRLRPVDELAAHRVWQLLCLDSWMRRFGLDGSSL
ncbi:asparagine synthase (glutamine-hydrolyzing) [Desulfohalovibrio reitneri]|uniref:asparagine synthase (glutamine-hydrolyzing) n=1 Tax=Desulfohalovibrio reitneri TaxID=1307759 RepID=UPI0004A6BA38|nr:asparagine synthase (glutamine-hydrolyzing) [Desulfohalovibrio reitneri]